ncbi:RNA polymerase I and III subunit C [Carabus blaptoides fortunei]
MNIQSHRMSQQHLQFSMIEGLIPLKADPRQFEFRPEGVTEGSERDTLEFELKIKCTWNKDSQNESTRADDMYKNNNVYSKHIKWLPIGDQASIYKESDVGPIHDDILIAKMRPGHELDLKLVAVKGLGRDHAKFSPVATASYRLLPDIKLTREVEGEQAELLQRTFSPGVIGLKRTADGRKIAVVNNSRYDTSSRNVFRYDELKDSVVMTKIRDHFIFTIESVGALKPEVLFIEAVKELRSKCKTLMDELNHA